MLFTSETAVILRFSSASHGGHYINTSTQFEECFEVNIMADNIVEDNETFTLHLSTNDEGVTFNGETVTVTIIDNDGEMPKYCHCFVITFII